jgi:hypothetical protein
MKNLIRIIFFLFSSWAFGGESLSLLKAAGRFSDTDRILVRVTNEDLMQVMRKYPLELRADFVLLILAGHDGKAILGLVPRSQKGVFPENLVGQQVVQWTKLDFPEHEIRAVMKMNEEGFIRIRHHDKIKRTKIFIAQKLSLEKVSFRSLLKEVQLRSVKKNAPRPGSHLLRLLFGRAHVKLLGSKGEINSLESSEILLRDNSVLKPKKEKILHVHGELFHGELTINQKSPFSGHLAPGKYIVLGRLSSGLKNLDVKDDQGKPQTNSIALGLLVFKTPDVPEVPGLLFLQDSLAPVKNSNLTSWQFTNNPGFAFRPTSIREFFEQGITVAGVGIASFLNQRDSARGVQGNFRGVYGMASNAVNLAAGESALGPRYLAMELKATPKEDGRTVVDTIRGDKNATFILRSSEDATLWHRIGSMSGLTWMGLDSHELTFPHGLSGTIDPMTLRPSSSVAGIDGLQVPTRMRKL